jgi:CubicO group peptidase (beta-lactamase class C family)
MAAAHVDMNLERLKQAVQFAIDHETAWTREPGDGWGIHHQDPAPWNRLLGPVHARGPVSGTLIVNGERALSWGEPDRPDLTFSVAKTYLALLAGVAHDQGLLPDVTEPVRDRVRHIGFDSGRNAEITWQHLLQQTSEWEGECWGVPDRVDRYRTLQFLSASSSGKKGEARPLAKPGTYWEYNDVRVNQLSLALLHLFRRPLPEVFRERIMQPLGASDSWRWLGYDNAWVEIDGRRMQSVPGGTHWGAVYRSAATIRRWWGRCCSMREWRSVDAYCRRNGSNRCLRRATSRRTMVT